MRDHDQVLTIERTRVMDDPTASVTAALLGLAGFEVLAAADAGGEVEVLVETRPAPVGCPRCGVIATAKDRRPVWVRDLPVGGRPVVICWVKRIWCCQQEACPVRTWTEDHEAIAPRAALTERARAWAFDQVGRCDAAVSDVAADLAVAWHTVMTQVRHRGTPIVDDEARLAAVSAVGVDETAFLRATGTHPTMFATGIADLSPGRPARLLDVVEGRSGTVLGGWLGRRDQSWRDEITTASLDPFRGYATALRTQLPGAVRVLDPFHVTRLALSAVDDVRRRVQQETTGHRGRTGDPLYGLRRVLRRRHDRLSSHAWRRLEAGLATSDPDGEVALAWDTAQKVMGLYQLHHPAEQADRAATLIGALRTCPIPELARLGRTLHAWRDELFAAFTNPDVSNGPTENLNLKIKNTKRVARGYRNFDNYRLRLLLNHGRIHEDHTPTRIRTRRPSLAA
jgi:transposase